MEENKEKKKKGKGLLIIILALIAAGGLTAAGLVFGPKLFKGKPVEPEEQTDEKVTLFWNVDREYYLIQNPTEVRHRMTVITTFCSLRKTDVPHSVL